MYFLFLDPPEKCNLIVTEIFDVALFGERALESILHALTILRTEDDFKIIPCGATVYVTGKLSIYYKIHDGTSFRCLFSIQPNSICGPKYM